jgi:hypothetical protein
MVGLDDARFTETSEFVLENDAVLAACVAFAAVVVGGYNAEAILTDVTVVVGGAVAMVEVEAVACAVDVEAIVLLESVVFTELGLDLSAAPRQEVNNSAFSSYCLISSRTSVFSSGSVKPSRWLK